jgi:hypothetical protein
MTIPEAARSLDPDDTGPLPLLEEPPRRRMQPGRAWKVDRDTPHLARLCAGWARHGLPLEDLVGLVRGCSCRPAVMPRAELPSRLAPGELLDALGAIRAVPGRLAVVETSSDRTEAARECREHHILVPPVDVPETGARLEPLSADRRALLDRRLDEKPGLGRILAKSLFDDHTPDALYVEATLLELGGCFQVQRRRYAGPKVKQLLDAADYEARPAKLLCLVGPDWVWQQDGVAWVEIERFGLHLEADPCWDELRLFDAFK